MKGSHDTCVERLLSTPGIAVNLKDGVSWSIGMNNTDTYHVPFRNTYIYMHVLVWEWVLVMSAVIQA